MDGADAAAALAPRGAIAKAGDTMSGRLIGAGGVQGNNGIGTAAGNLGEVEVRGNGTGAAAMAFHRRAPTRLISDLIPTMKWKVGGASAGAVAREVFHQGNTVGTVSQSSGVPTGAIVERGSSVSGEYTKYADGTMICSRRLIRAPGVIAGGAFVSLGSYTVPGGLRIPAGCHHLLRRWMVALHYLGDHRRIGHGHWQCLFYQSEQHQSRHYRHRPDVSLHRCRVGGSEGAV